MQSKDLVRDKTEEETIPRDTAQLPKRSKWEEFLLTLQLTGIAFIVLGVIWGIEYWKNG